MYHVKNQQGKYLPGKKKVFSKYLEISGEGRIREKRDGKCVSSFPELLEQSTTNWMASNNRHLFSHSFGARSPRSGISRLMLSRGSREESFLASSSSRRVAAILGVPWLVDALQHCYVTFSPQVPVSLCLLQLVGITHIELRSTLLQYDLTLPNHIFDKSISKYSHIGRYWELGLQHNLLRGYSLIQDRSYVSRLQAERNNFLIRFIQKCSNYLS